MWLMSFPSFFLEAESLSLILSPYLYPTRVPLSRRDLCFQLLNLSFMATSPPIITSDARGNPFRSTHTFVLHRTRIGGISRARAYNSAWVLPQTCKEGVGHSLGVCATGRGSCTMLRLDRRSCQWIRQELVAGAVHPSPS